MYQGFAEGNKRSFYLTKDYYNVSDVGAVANAAAAVANLGTAAMRTAAQKEAITQAKLHCGKKPHGVFGIKTKKKKKEIEDWENCVSDYENRLLKDSEYAAKIPLTLAQLAQANSLKTATQQSATQIKMLKYGLVGVS